MQNEYLCAPMFGFYKETEAFSPYAKSRLNLFLDSCSKMSKDIATSYPNDGQMPERTRAFLILQIVKNGIDIFNEFLPLFDKGKIPSRCYLATITAPWFILRCINILLLIAKLFSQPEELFYFNLFRLYAEKNRIKSHMHINNIKELLGVNHKHIYGNPFLFLGEIVVPGINYNPFQELVDLNPTFSIDEKQRLESAVFAQLEKLQDTSGFVNLEDLCFFLLFERVSKDEVYYTFLERASELCELLPGDFKDLVPFLNPEVFCSYTSNQGKLSNNNIELISKEDYRYEIINNGQKQIIDLSEYYRQFKSLILIICSCARRHYLSLDLSNNIAEVQRRDKLERIEHKIKQDSQELLNENNCLAQKYEAIAQKILSRIQEDYLLENFSIDYLTDLLESRAFLKSYIEKQNLNLTLEKAYLLSLGGNSQFYRLATITYSITQNIKIQISEAEQTYQKIENALLFLQARMLSIESLEEEDTLQVIDNKLTKNQTITQQLLTLGETYLNSDIEQIRTLIEHNMLNLKNSNQALSDQKMQIGFCSKIINARISTIRLEIQSIEEKIDNLTEKARHESTEKDARRSANSNQTAWSELVSWGDKVFGVLPSNDIQEDTSMVAAQSKIEEADMDYTDEIGYFKNILAQKSNSKEFLICYQTFESKISVALNFKEQSFPSIDSLIEVFNYYEYYKKTFPSEDISIDAEFHQFVEAFENYKLNLIKVMSGFFLEKYRTLQEECKSIHEQFNAYKTLEAVGDAILNRAIENFELYKEQFESFRCCKLLSDCFSTDMPALFVPSKEDVAQIKQRKELLQSALAKMQNKNLSDDFKAQVEDYIQNGNLIKLIQWTRENKPTASNSIADKTKWHKMRAVLLEEQFPQNSTDTTFTVTEVVSQLHIVLDNMKDKFANTQENNTICTFIDDLKQDLKLFALKKIDSTNIQDKFLTKLHQQDEFMHQKDTNDIWCYWVANIVIGIFTLGIALALKWEYTRRKQGFGELFFAETSKEKSIRAIERVATECLVYNLL